MTDYLEEHLEDANALLEQVRNMERSGIGPIPVREEEAGSDEPAAPEGQSGGPEGERREYPEQQETVEALKQKVDRMENLVDGSGLALEERDKEAEPAANRPDRLGDGAPVSDPASKEGGGEDREEAGSGGARTNAERAEKKSIPLAVQMEELDRAVSALAAAVPEGQGAQGRRGEYPVSLSRAGGGAALFGEAGSAEGWSPGRDGGSSGPAAGGALRWAEQADRIFRRDSRRYDGGFYLY